MRRLVVGHSYVTPFAQAKYVAMKTLRPDLALRVVVPQVWRHLFGSYRPELAAGPFPEELVIIRSFGGSTNMSYMLDPVALGALMRRFDPTHIHIEEDPYSAVGAEAVWLASRISSNAAEAISDRLRPPFSLTRSPSAWIAGATTLFIILRAA